MRYCLYLLLLLISVTSTSTREITGEDTRTSTTEVTIASVDEVTTTVVNEVATSTIKEVKTSTDDGTTSTDEGAVTSNTDIATSTDTISVTPPGEVNKTSVHDVTNEVTVASPDARDVSDSGAEEVMDGLEQTGDYYRLEDRLFSRYKVHLRPVKSHRIATNLSIGIDIFAVHEIIEYYQTLRQSLWVTMEWTDVFLTWDPTEFDGLDRIEVPISKLWYPKVAVRNVVSSSVMLLDTSVPAMLSSDGRVMWIQPIMLETLCQLDSTFYPFDSQTCSVIVDMWMSSEAEVNLTSVSIQNDWAVNQENSEWKVTSQSLQRISNTYGKQTYSTCIFSLQLQRRRLFHTLTLIVPNVLLALLTPLVFLLPQDSGEKMSFCMSLLLTFAVNLSVLVSSMPRSSLHVSVLMVYLTCLSVVTALAVITSAYLLRLYHRADRLVGSKAKVVILFLRALCMLHGRQQRGTRLKGRETDKPTEGNDDPHDSLDLVTLQVTCEKVNVKSTDQTNLDDNNKEMTWKDAAAILDSVCLRVFIFIVVSMTSVVALVFSIESKTNNTNENERGLWR